MYLPITAKYDIQVDSDRTLAFQVWDPTTLGAPTQFDPENGRPISYAGIDAGTARMMDVVGQKVSFTLRKKPTSPETLIYKTTESGGDVTIVGVFDPDPEVNQQRIKVRLRNHDTWDPDASPAVYIKGGTYSYAVKRIDEDQEDVYSDGPFVLVQSAARE